MIRSQAEAERSGFAGSPTIMIDRKDAFAEPHGPPALASRVYPTPAGLGGLPHPHALRAALHAAVAAPGVSKP